MTSKKNETILLIDDDQKMLSLLTTLLQLEGYVSVPLISPAPDVIIKAINEHHPLAMILDVHLSDRNGIDILKSIHPKLVESAVSVMMTSGEDLRRQCLDAGADEFLLKPYMPTELIDWLHKKSLAFRQKES